METTWKNGDVIIFSDDLFVVLENYGSTGKVRELNGTIIINKFYWEFDQTKCELMGTLGSMVVWWIRNPPRKGERYPVKSIDEALDKLDQLANYDLKHCHVWANAGGLKIYTENGWEEYTNSDGDSIDEIRLNKGK